MFDIDKYSPIKKEENILQVFGSLFCNQMTLSDIVINSIIEHIPTGKEDLLYFLEEQKVFFLEIQDKSSKLFYCQMFLDNVNDVTRLTERYVLNNLEITDFEILILDSLITNSTVRQAFRYQIKTKRIYKGENKLYIKKNNIIKRKSKKSKRFVSCTPKARLFRQFSDNPVSKGQAESSRNRIASGNKNNYKKDSSGNQPHLIYIASGGMNKRY